jgi:hypothetical protein
MKNLFLIFYCILNINFFSLAVTIDGYIYLEGQTNHSNVEIILERTAPYQIFDTIYSGESGYYSKEIENGIYKLTFQKPNYFKKYLIDVSCYVNITLDADTLIQITSLIEVPSVISTIQEAIDVALTHDTILVSPGIYYENINFLGKEILLTSNFLYSKDIADINNTIIDGGNNGTVVIFDTWEDNNTILSGFSIRNGNANGSYPDNFGGGIRCQVSSPALSNLKVYNNNSIYGGGGIMCYTSNAILKNIEVFGNSAGATGGGIELYSGNTTLDNILVHHNNALNSGGGIFNCDNTTTIRNSTICYNDVINHDPYTQGGAGIYMFDSDLSIHNSIITDNTGSEGIHVGLGNSPLVNYCNVWNNELGNFYQCNPLYGINVTVNSNSDPCDAFYNIQFNPQYLNPANNNFRLWGVGPCIEAGSNNYVYEQFGLDGEIRIYDGNMDTDTIVDMGAYEFVCKEFNISQQPNSYEECEGENVTFEIFSQGELIFYQWQKNDTDIPDAIYSSYTINDIILADSGEYRCKISNVCDTIYSEPGNLVIHPFPTQPSGITGNTEICQDSPNTEYITTESLYADNYVWEINPGMAGIITGTGIMASVDWNDNYSGLATISVYGENDCGNGIPSQIDVVINPVLSVGVTIEASSNPACVGDEVVLFATPVNGGINPGYQWQINGVNAGSNSPTYTINNPANDDEVVCFLTSSESCTINNPATSNVITMVVYSLPIVEITASPNDTVCTNQVIILDAGNEGATFEWSTGETTQQIEVVNESGGGGGLQSYWVTVTNSNNCHATNDIEVYFDPCTSYQENTNNFFIGIFPNPARERIVIKVSGLKTKFSVLLTNQYGEILKTEVINKNTEEYSGAMDLSNYPQGIYFLKFQEERGEFVKIKKLVIL